MKIVYIAGPYRASTAWEIEANVRRAEKAALYVAACGYVPLCPHSMYRFFHGQLTEDFWMDATLELLKKADYVYVLHGWERSNGTRKEIELATTLGTPIVFDGFNTLPIGDAK